MTFGTSVNLCSCPPRLIRRLFLVFILLVLLNYTFRNTADIKSLKKAYGTFPSQMNTVPFLRATILDTIEGNQTDGKFDEAAKTLQTSTDGVSAIVSNMSVVKAQQSFKETITKNATAGGMSFPSRTERTLPDGRQNIAEDEYSSSRFGNRTVGWLMNIVKQRSTSPPGASISNSSLGETYSATSQAELAGANISNARNLTAEEQWERLEKPNNITDEWLLKCATFWGQQPSKGPFPTVRPHYAIGDCIRMCNKCEWGRKRGFSGYVNWTIAGAYANLVCPDTHPQFVREGNFSAVSQVFRHFEKEFPHWTKPDPEAIVLHLRLGDMIEYSRTPVGEMLTSGGYPHHRPRSYPTIKSYYEYARHIDEAEADKVLIIGGSHKPKLFKKSRVYASCLERALRAAGKNVSMQLDGGDADKDFYVMSHAKKIMVSVGGFSTLIGNYVEYNGGKIYGGRL